MYKTRRERTVRHHVEILPNEDERSRFCLHRKESMRYKIIIKRTNATYL